MTIELTKFRLSPDREPGTYKPCSHPERETTAIAICPHCGAKLHIFPHKIFDDGKVFPSVVCHTPNCFHGYIQLEGWAERNSLLLAPIRKDLEHLYEFS